MADPNGWVSKEGGKGDLRARYSAQAHNFPHNLPDPKSPLLKHRSPTALCPPPPPRPKHCLPSLSCNPQRVHSKKGMNIVRSRLLLFSHRVMPPPPSSMLSPVYSCDGAIAISQGEGEIEVRKFSRFFTLSQFFAIFRSFSASASCLSTWRTCWCPVCPLCRSVEASGGLVKAPQLCCISPAICRNFVPPPPLQCRLQFS